MKFVLFLAALSLCSTVSPLAAATNVLHRDVLVFVPAYEGCELFDPDLDADKDAAPVCVWGNLNVFFSSTRYFALRMPNPLTPRPLLAVGPVDVYRGMVDALTRPNAADPAFVPYTRESDFFIFTYDWRQEIASVSAPQFGHALEQYAGIHAAKTGISAGETHFILVSHSMGGTVVRTWLSENPAMAPRVRDFYMVGAPNRGSVKAAATVVYGPVSLKSAAKGFSGELLRLLPTSVDQNVTKLTGITRPTLYELLPFDDPNWVDHAPDGATRHLGATALLEAATWEPFWPTAALERRLFIDDWLEKRQQEGRKTITPADWEFCQDPAQPKLRKLLADTAAWRARLGSLHQIGSLLTAPGGATRLHLVLSTGLRTPSGFMTWGRHDDAKMVYTYEHGDDGDGTMEALSVLDGYAADAPNVKLMHGVPHGRLMLDPQFLTYFIAALAAHQPTVTALR